MLKITKRPATVHDFIMNKEYKPWSGWRRTAKTENFSLLFGCAPGRFGQTLRNNKFSESDCDNLIKNAHLEGIMNSLRESKSNLDILSLKYYTCAKFMRDGFFEGYKGMGDRITREQQYAIKHGYVRCWHGPVRHIPELKLMKWDVNGNNLLGADKDLWSKHASEAKNIACNSTIQTMEVRIAFASIHWLCDTVKHWGLKSFMYSMCHDSEDWVIYDKEQDLILALVKYACSFEREPLYGVHMNVDCELSDISTPEKRKTNYYHHGEGTKCGNIIEELKKYNEKMHTNLVLPPLTI